MTHAVSILVPVYNVSNYIERCAHSLFLQTFDDIEYIFVNDGTPDDSIEKLQKIIGQYPSRKNNIKIIHHKKREGVVVARETALNASSGEYISFIDSDDFIEPDMIESMYNAAKKENADVVVCDFWIDYFSKKEYREDYIPESKNELYFEFLNDERTFSSLCNKLIRHTLCLNKGCRVPADLKYRTDGYAMLRIYYYANKIIKINKPFYHYIQYNLRSITKSKSEQHYESIILFWTLNDAFFQEKKIDEKYQNAIEFGKIKNKIRLLIDIDSYRLRKKYAFMFRDFEMKYIQRFRRGEKIMLFLVHYKLFFLAHIFNKLLMFKNRKYRLSTNPSL